MNMLTGWLRQQSTHTGIVMLALVALASRTAGIDLTAVLGNVAEDVAGIAAVAGTLSAAAKVMLPDVPAPAPAPAPAADVAALPLAAAIDAIAARAGDGGDDLRRAVESAQALARLVARQ